jgi:eukaryotic-like serine/threonine-protein kinase
MSQEVPINSQPTVAFEGKPAQVDPNANTLDRSTLDEPIAEPMIHIDVEIREDGSLGSLTTNSIGIDIPGYELIRELGRGGMGVVYLAKQMGLNRHVALKMIIAGSHAAENEVSRFRSEAEAIAKLRHPNIVHIYEVDEHEGKPFFSIEYCSEGTLDRKLRGKPLGGIEAAGLVETLARAMQVAHEAGLVHRDLKPQNILLTPTPSSGRFRAVTTRFESMNTVPNLPPAQVSTDLIGQSSGIAACPLTDLTPKITDFGLAKKLDPMAEQQTHTGVIMGTPSYMSPEQASGHIRKIGPTTDIYALGAILYECVTGRAPFIGPTALDTVMQVINHEPVPPRLLNPKIDADLEKVILKCLEKNPAQRYTSAEELAQDLFRYQQGEPVTARSINLLERMGRELNYSQHEKQLRPLGSALLYLALLVFLSHLATSVMLVSGIPESLCFWIPRFGFILGLAAWIYRLPGNARSLWPTNSIERLIWAVWGGYLIASVFILWVQVLQGHGHLDIYGIGAVLSGFGWFVMGGTVWGGCYLIGLIQMAVAPLLALMEGSKWSPLAFGCLWGVTLSFLGLRYRLQKE